MKINFLGDSITEGAGADLPGNKFTSLVSNYFGAQECNFGKSGTRIAKQKKRTNNPDFEFFMTRAILMPRDADFTFVFGGTNDYGHGDAKLGNIGDRDDDTFYGAFNNLVEYLVANFHKDKVCFILPLPRFDQDNPYGDGSKDDPIASLSSYIRIEREILARYGVAWLDFSDIFPEPTSMERNEYFADGLHPNSYGHKILAERLISYLETIQRK